MDPKPRRGRLRRWAALLATLVCRGAAWVRRAATALRNRLGRRRVVFFVVKPGDRRGEVRSARTSWSPSDDSDPRNRAAAQEERRGRSPSARARRLTEDRSHGEDGDDSAAAALVPSEDTAPSNSSAAHDRVGRSPSPSPPRLPEDRAHGEVGDDSAAAALSPGEVTGASLGEHRKHGEQGSSRGNTHHDNQQGRHQEGDESPRCAALGEKTRNDEKNAEHDGAKAPGEDAAAAAAAATPGADGVALGWYPGGEPTKTGDRSVAPGRSKNSSAPRAAPATEEENTERGGGRIAAPTTTRQATGINGAAHGGFTGAEQDAENSGHSKKPSPEEENSERGGTRIASSTTTRRDSTRQAAGLIGAADGGCSGGERAQNGSAAGAQAKQEPHEAPAAPLDALPGGSDAVLVQPDLAAAPAGGSGKAAEDSSSCGRRRHRVRRNKKPTTDPLILPSPDEEEDDVPQEAHDREIQLHQTYRDKSAVCRKNYIYCLMCHLNNEEELEKDKDKIEHHCKTIHKCDRGGILCQKKGCFVRAKYKREIGLHEYVCRKRS